MGDGKDAQIWSECIDRTSADMSSVIATIEMKVPFDLHDSDCTTPVRHILSSSSSAVAWVSGNHTGESTIFPTSVTALLCQSCICITLKGRRGRPNSLWMRRPSAWEYSWCAAISALMSGGVTYQLTRTVSILAMVKTMRMKRPLLQVNPPITLQGIIWHHLLALRVALSAPAMTRLQEERKMRTRGGWQTSLLWGGGRRRCRVMRTWVKRSYRGNWRNSLGTFDRCWLKDAVGWRQIKLYDVTSTMSPERSLRYPSPRLPWQGLHQHTVL